MFPTVTTMLSILSFTQFALASVFALKLPLCLSGGSITHAPVAPSLLLVQALGALLPLFQRTDGRGCRNMSDLSWLDVGHLRAVYRRPESNCMAKKHG